MQTVPGLDIYLNLGAFRYNLSRESSAHQVAWVGLLQ